MRSVLTTFVGLVVASWAVRARGDVAAVRLVYTREPGSETCTDEATLRGAIDERTGADPFSPVAARTVVVRLSPGRPSGFVAHVMLLDEGGAEQGARELRTTGPCADLVDTVALAIAIALDPHALARSLTSGSETATGAPQGTVSPDSAPPIAQSPEPEPSPGAERPAANPLPYAPRARLAVETSAGVVGSVGSLPAPNIGFGVGVALRWPSASMELEGHADLPASAAAPIEGRVSASLLAAELLLCGHTGPWFLCGLGEGGAMQAVGEGTAGTHASVPWWAAGARLGARIRLGHTTFLRLRGDAVVDLQPPKLVLNGAPAWTAPRAAASLGVDAVVRFP